MACPYFMPVEKIENGNWPHPARLPLGCGWSGHCTAPGHEGAIPAQSTLECFCNLGYASGCEWAPSPRTRDSVRFSMSGLSSGNPRRLSDRAEAEGRVLSVAYVFERDHRPVEHGSLEFDAKKSVWITPHPDPCVQKMAECYLDSCMKRRT